MNGGDGAPRPPRVRLRGRLVVVSHKPCWPSGSSPSGFATTGGFPMQMAALAELFDETVLCVPIDARPTRSETDPLTGPGLRVVALDPLPPSGPRRRLRTLTWAPTNTVRVAREIRHADVVHTPIPGDVGSLALVLAPLLRQRLLVRYCGSWEVTKTAAERAWKAYMRRRTKSRDVMVATGADGAGAAESPALRWVFATALREAQLDDLSRRAAAAQRSGLVTVGRQVTEKGTEQAIRALRRLHDWALPVTLDVVGDGADLPRFRALAGDLGLGEHVAFHGQLTHRRVLDQLLAAEVFVQPTLASEGFGKAVVEALACGLPVVGSRSPAIGPGVRSAGAGVVVEPTDVTAIASAVRELLTDRPRLDYLHTEAPRVVRELSLERWRDALGSFMAEAWPELIRAPALER